MHDYCVCSPDKEKKKFFELEEIIINNIFDEEGSDLEIEKIYYKEKTGKVKKKEKSYLRHANLKDVVKCGSFSEKSGLSP